MNKLYITFIVLLSIFFGCYCLNQRYENTKHFNYTVEIVSQEGKILDSKIYISRSSPTIRYDYYGACLYFPGCSKPTVSAPKNCVIRYKNEGINYDYFK